jgi:hypothetical protein
MSVEILYRYLVPALPVVVSVYALLLADDYATQALDLCTGHSGLVRMSSQTETFNTLFSTYISKNNMDILRVYVIAFFTPLY